MSFSDPVPPEKAWGIDAALSRTRPRTKSDSGYTYVITASGLGLKIGHSRRPAGRLSEMQVGSPVGMTLVHSWRLSPEGSKLLENQLHAAFAFTAIRGEWFRAEPLAVIAMGNLFVEGRIADALQLGVLLQERVALEDRYDRAHRAWYYYRGNNPKERTAAEKAGKLLEPGIRRELAQNELAALELGLWEHERIDSRWGKVRLQQVREAAA